MVRPYSLDLRERVVAAAEAGQSCRAVARRFGVSVSSVVKWRQRACATGSAAAKPMGGKRPVLLAGQRAFILARIALKPHISIRALQAELAAQGTTAS
jgi:transposase